MVTCSSYTGSSNYSKDLFKCFWRKEWKREAICAACRVRKSAPLLTASIVFGVASGDAAWSQSDVCGKSAQIIAARGYSTSQLLFGPRQVQWDFGGVVQA